MKKNKPESLLQLDALCNITGAATLAESAKKVLQGPGPIKLGASSVVKIDAACLQLLSALVSEAHRLGRQVIWEKPSPALLESAFLLGLTKHLGLEQNPS